MRKKIIVANWKMNFLKSDVEKYLENFLDLHKTIKTKSDIVFCSPFLYLQMLTHGFKGTNIFVGAQNMSEHEFGAYTGEVSAPMLYSLNISHCIIGHSERRQYNKESNEQLAQKVNNALKHSIVPIFCCGESIAQRNANIHYDIIESQLNESLFHLSPEQIQKVIIAYEPVWAIGTGVTATTEQAQDMHRFIRKVLENKYSNKISANIPILYGGSCNAQNAEELFNCQDVDGGLIGGASLKPNEFIKVILSANNE